MDPDANVFDIAPEYAAPAKVSFVAPEAQFTPKQVETSELRTSLVYEIRVFVKDPGDDLRLGMPATVHLRLDQGPTAPTPALPPSGPLESRR